ncbi:hypothetical protein BDU57DRAFT_523202 [Ampelomyces quisqualis]|uniref:Uncharacterized protein n=1 Tax=Ampelomyces quisqualis TaxID=50730 RepID=A0A6A5QAS7_AMPQU|nr:hypothetical protein BDU57DRAFT_523202 [Ampelomyces quisqualis]
MPLHAERPIVRVEHSSMRTIETRNTENLFGLWSVFARCSPAMEDGKRYENMAWRLWSRETFCCQPDHLATPQWSFEQQLPADMPELSTSVASDDSNLDTAMATASRPDSAPAARPHLRRHDSATSHARGKHMTPIGLEKVVNSIQEKKFLEPLSPLPPHFAAPAAEQRLPAQVSTPRPAPPPTTARRIPESSTSTVATTHDSEPMSPPVGSEASTSTDMSRHSVVRGFDRGHISTSIRSSTSPNPTPILKTSSSFVARPPPSRLELAKKKQPMFTLGGSSDEDAASSFEAYSMRHGTSLMENLRKAPPMRKTTSFKNEVTTRTYQDMTSESDGAIESDSEDDVDESAIDEDDSEEDWEDEGEEVESGASSPKESGMFPRVESKANLASHRSLLTTALHEGDRERALRDGASRSTSAIRRSRTTPNGPSTGNSPQEEGLMMRPSKPKPIIMTTSNVHPPAMSPRTTRRMMLQSELTSSLRQNLLWERQQKNATSNAVAKRQHSAVSLPALRRAATTSNITSMANDAQQQNQNKTSAPFMDDARFSSLNQDVYSAGLNDTHW